VAIENDITVNDVGVFWTGKSDTKYTGTEVARYILDCLRKEKVNNNMDVLQIGTDVRIIDAAKGGKISCIHIRENESVTYDVIFWIGDSRKCEDFAAYEFKVLDKPVQTQTIGFNGGKDD